MLRRYVAAPLLYIFLGGMCLSFSSGNSNNDHSSPSSGKTPQKVKPGISDDNTSNSQKTKRQASGREEIAYMDERGEDIHRRANRMGDWDYRQNWRYDREAFYKGETQAEAVEEEYPYGTGGIGYDPDKDYLQMRKFYLEDVEKNRQNALDNRNRGNSNNPSNTNHRPYYNQQGNYNRSSGTDYSTNRPNMNQSNYNRANGRGYADNHTDYHRNAANREVGDNYNPNYARGTNPDRGGTYYPNDGDSNMKYDWSKQNSERDYRSGTNSSYDPSYNHQEDRRDRYSWQ